MEPTNTATIADPLTAEGLAARAAERAAIGDRLRATPEPSELVVTTTAIVDGRRMRVPLDPAKREAFIAEHRERESAAAAARAAVDDEVSAFAAATELERVERWADPARRDALHRMGRTRSAI